MLSLKPAYEFIRRNIASSSNEFHFDCCRKMIEVFFQHFPHNQGETRELSNMLSHRQEEVSAYTLKFQNRQKATA